MSPLLAVDVSDQILVTGLVVVVLVSLIAGAEKAVGLWQRLKDPPRDMTAYATHDELIQVERRLERNLDETFGRVNRGLGELRQTVGTELRALNRSLGRIEGIVSRHGAPPATPFAGPDPDVGG